MIRKVATFDEFAAACDYFESNTEVNNGYGCTHPKQEEYQHERDPNVGCCFCHSCPLGIEADAEDIYNPDVDWDGYEPDPDCMEGEYLMIDITEDATLEEKRALENYERRLRRWDTDWLESNPKVRVGGHMKNTKNRH